MCNFQRRDAETKKTVFSVFATTFVDMFSNLLLRVSLRLCVSIFCFNGVEIERAR